MSALKSEMQSVQAQAQQMFDPIAQGLGDIALEGRNVAEVIAGIGKTFVRMAIQWISKQAAMRVAQQTTSKVMIASKASETAAVKTAAVSQIAAKGASAAAGAAESQSSIPIVGPILAVAAAVAMLAFVLGLAGGFNRGGVVPGGGANRDSTFAALTPGERVLTRQQTEGFDRLVNAVAGGTNNMSNSMVIQLPESGNVDFEQVARLEEFIESRLAPSWFRMLEEGRIGDQSLVTRRA